MGGSCCCQDISDEDSTNVENPVAPADISSDWDEYDDQDNEDKEGSQEMMVEEKQTNDEDCKLAQAGPATGNIESASNVDMDTEEPTVSEEPLKMLYGEKELVARKQRAFALDLKLYKNTKNS